MQSEAEAKKNADMLQFLGEFAGGDDRKRGAFRNKEKLQFANENEEGMPKAATEEARHNIAAQCPSSPRQ